MGVVRKDGAHSRVQNKNLVLIELDQNGVAFVSLLDQNRPRSILPIHLFQHRFQFDQRVPRRGETGIDSHLKDRFEDLIDPGPVVDRHPIVQSERLIPPQTRQHTDAAQRPRLQVDHTPGPDPAAYDRDHFLREIGADRLESGDQPLDLVLPYHLGELRVSPIVIVQFSVPPGATLP